MSTLKAGIATTMKATFLVLLLAVAAASADDEELSANINDYMDQIMDGISNTFINLGLDPMPLPDQTAGLSVRDLLGIRWHGEIELTKGELKNLAKTERKKDATVSYNLNDKHLELRFELGFEKVEMDYKFRAQIMYIGPKGKIIGKIKKLQLLMDFVVDINTLDITVKKIHFTKTGRITVSVDTGIFGTISDLILNSIVNTVTLIFEGLIVDVVEVTINAVFKQVVENLHLGNYILGLGRHPQEWVADIPQLK